jgi:predicted negative regulator of RcsB-dependent stress response
MSTPAPSASNSTPNDPNQPVVEPGFEYKLHEFWRKNSGAVYAFCAVVLLVILGKGGYDMYVRWQNDKVSAEYRSATTSEKLKSFAASHSGHLLAGAAKLRLADEAYVAGNFGQAASDYQAAAEIFKAGPLGSRARLGAAMSKVMGGQNADGEAQLKLIANDASLLKTVRAEAAYQLASLDVQAGRTDEALKYLDQVNAVDPASTWAQRAMMLRATLPAPTATKP